jgi:hypothetical protein
LAGIFILAAGVTSWAVWPTSTTTATKATLSRMSLLSPEAEQQADAFMGKIKLASQPLMPENLR